eukprot:CAMPEP_0181454760 /NCGR_PEP_ID=MMETSP1110-20121109/30405_1 /TAXON_ID=174948 /ORGANISM="Symbiodinium sp., Strain CCMP421" /LENGTH=91 /DNA_ID=CAMNT_0023579117 /DNA_START=58 /DNA_END=333 /DNA_ORIENTATION=-
MGCGASTGVEPRPVEHGHTLVARHCIFKEVELTEEGAVFSSWHEKDLLPNMPGPPARRDHERHVEGLNKFLKLCAHSAHLESKVELERQWA